MPTQSETAIQSDLSHTNSLSSTARSAPRWLPLLLLGLILLLVALIRLRMLSIYLDRDEGEYAYSGQLILDGYPPYVHSYNMKLPGAYYAYAFIMRLFGETPSGIHFGFLLINLSTIVFVYLLARKLAGDFAAVIAAWCFGLLAMDENVLGLHAQATHFVVAFAIPGVLVLLHALERQSLRLIFASGVLFGVAFLMKQHGIFLFLFALCWTMIDTARKRSLLHWQSASFLAALTAGFASICLLVCAVMFERGVFSRFWFWTVDYARAYSSLTSPSQALTHFYLAFGAVTRSMLALWLVALIALIVLALDKARWRQNSIIFLLLFFFIGAICPGFYFSEHYFVLMFPALAIVTGAGLRVLRDQINLEYPHKGVAIASALFVIAVGVSLYSERYLFFEVPPSYEARKVYAANPYPEALEIAKYIQAHSTPSDRIAIFGSEPEIYFYSHRLAASGQLYFYGLFEKQPFARAMQQQFASEAEAAQPKFAIFIGVNDSWMPADPQPAPEFIAWMKSFLQKYQIVGQVTIRTMQRTDYDWISRPTAPTPAPPMQYNLLVYERL